MIVPAFMSSSHLSARQRFVRRRASRLPFPLAVRFAADRLFRFTHRSGHAEALWSDTEQVWLGRTTFLAWATDVAVADIPRMVIESAGAPENARELHDAVRAELIAYWRDLLGSLPGKCRPPWLPLP